MIHRFDSLAKVVVRFFSLSFPILPPYGDKMYFVNAIPEGDDALHMGASGLFGRFRLQHHMLTRGPVSESESAAANCARGGRPRYPCVARTEALRRLPREAPASAS
jgi:hypothetical protein